MVKMLEKRLGTLMIIFFKSGKLIKAMKIFKVLKFTKPLVTLGTMTLSALTYSFFLGPWFAIGLVLLLFVHEMGHVIALRQKGLNASAPVFIPMLGAAIFCPKLGDRDTEAYVGIGGPLYGAAISLIVYGLWWVLPGQPQLLLSLAHFSAFLNLFNMIPIRPLDGGRIMQAAGSWYRYVGVIMLLAFTLYARNPGMMLIWIFILGDFSMDYKIRAWMASACLVSMTILMTLGHGDQGLLINTLDVIIGLLCIGSYLSLRMYRVSEEENLPALPTKKKISWSIKYFALGTILAVMLVATTLQMQRYLPEPKSEIEQPALEE